MHNLNLHLMSNYETQNERIHNLELDLSKAKTQLSDQDKEIVLLKMVKSSTGLNLADSKFMLENMKRDVDEMKKKVRDTTEELHIQEMKAAEK